jgi:hypothetical protein
MTPVRIRHLLVLVGAVRQPRVVHSLEVASTVPLRQPDGLAMATH